MSDFVVGVTIPHPELGWREFGERTVRRMVRHGIERAPWNDRDIWLWAASTRAGCEWLEREVEYWHARMNERDRMLARALRRKPILEPGDPIEYDDGEASGTFTDQLRARERRDEIERRYRDGW